MEETQQTITKELLFKYLFLYSIISVLVTVILSVLFSSAASYIISKEFGGGTIQNLPVKTVSEQSAVIGAVQKANPAVVSIVISQEVQNIPQTLNPLDPFGFLNQNQQNQSGTSQQTVGAGSGFIISSDGYIVTNKHVASDTSSTYTVILSTGKSYTGHIVATDPTNDIAIMKIDATNLPFVTLSTSSNLQLGQTVIAIGNALGQYENTVSAGVISGLNRVVTASDQSGSVDETLHNVLQTDAQINPGNSGGPLLNIEGEVVGINTAVAQNANGIGFAIPIDQAKSDIKAAETTGKITKPELGVRYQIIDQNYLQSNPNTPYTYGAIVEGDNSGDAAVVSGSPADKAGIVSGDIILTVNGTQVNDTNTLSSLIQSHNVGDTVSLQVYHNKSVETLKVTLSQSF